MKIYIGNDLVHLPRFEKSLQLEKFIAKIFHLREIEYCEKKKDKLSSYAARFAAKEAFSKALGTGLYAQGVAPTDVWIENLESGKPQLFYSEKLREILRTHGITGCDVSLSHHGEYAMAHVVLY
ncbi:MAG: holo-ACP synthase [Bdellovibrionota bacterium]